MKRFVTLCSAAGMLLVLVLVTPASAVVTYSLDDGTHDKDYTLITGSTVWWANCFDMQPGGEVITSIEVYFGSTSGLNPAGQSFTVLLYDDTDDDEDPRTNLLLLSDGNFMTGTLGKWSSYDIPDATVSGKFFAAAQLTPSANQFPASLDQTTSAGKSWIAGFHPYVPPKLIDNYGNAGNWMLRAIGTSGVIIPAPSAILLCGIGVGLVGWLRKRRTL